MTVAHGEWMDIVTLTFNRRRIILFIRVQVRKQVTLINAQQVHSPRVQSVKKENKARQNVVYHGKVKTNTGYTGMLVYNETTNFASQLCNKFNCYTSLLLFYIIRQCIPENESVVMK